MSSPYIIRIVIHAPDTRVLESHDMINGDAFDDVPAEARKILAERMEQVLDMLSDHCSPVQEVAQEVAQDDRGHTSKVSE